MEFYGVYLTVTSAFCCATRNFFHMLSFVNFGISVFIRLSALGFAALHLDMSELCFWHLFCIIPEGMVERFVLLFLLSYFL
jgi:hypothetical protein